MLVLFHTVDDSGAVQIDASLMSDDIDPAKDKARQLAENHPGRTVFIAKSIGFMKAPQTQAEWVDQ